MEEWPAPPPPPPGWVTVAVSWCGICGTDLEEFLHGPNLVPTIVVGIHPGRIPVDFTSLVIGEKTVVTSLAHALDPDYLEAIRMLEGDDIAYEGLVSARIHLSQVVSLGLEALASDRDGNLKILVECSGI